MGERGRGCRQSCAGTDAPIGGSASAKNKAHRGEAGRAEVSGGNARRRHPAMHTVCQDGSIHRSPTPLHLSLHSREREPKDHPTKTGHPEPRGLAGDGAGFHDGTT